MELTTLQQLNMSKTLIEVVIG